MELLEYSIAELQELFGRGEWTSVDLCLAFLERISEIDSAGPMLRSVIELNPDALAIAEKLGRVLNSLYFTVISMVNTGAEATSRSTTIPLTYPYQSNTVPVA